MSRISKRPIPVPTGVTVTFGDENKKISIKGEKGSLHFLVHDMVSVVFADGFLKVEPRNNTTQANALAGTTQATLSNIVIGVTKGFEKKLELLGVGYRGQLQGQTLTLMLGYSLPVTYQIPEFIAIELPTQTEIIVRGLDKQLVGYVAAKIRSFRPPEPYKGKGIRYAAEKVLRKETKKKK